MSGFYREFHHALRRLRAGGLLTTSAVLSLSVGLGCYVLAARLVDSLFWSSPPGLDEPDRLLRVFGSLPSRDVARWDQAFSYPDYEAFARVSTAVSGGLAAWTTTGVSLGKGLEAVRATATVISPEYFAVLGLRARRGVALDRELPADSVVLSDAFWRSHYGASEEILGSPILVSGRPLVVRAVLPAGFRGLDPNPADLWLPNPAMDWLLGLEARSDSRRKFLRIVVRLAPSAARPAAQQAFTAVAQNRAKEVPSFWSSEPAVTLAPLSPGQGPSPPPEARIARGIAALSIALLLAAIVNTAYWLLVRTLDRERDLAVRCALGASPSALRLEPMVELGLALSGGLALGIAAQSLVDPLLAKLLPLASRHHESLDGRVILATLLVAGVVLFLCGILPYLWSRRLDLSRVLNPIRLGITPTSRRLRLALPLVQVAAATLLIALAATFLASLQRLESQDLGLSLDSVLVLRADFARAGFESGRTAQMLEEIEQRLKRHSGVSATALVASVPFETIFSAPVEIPGIGPLPDLPGDGPYWNAVSAGYFETMGLRLLQGRYFDATDRADSGLVAVINESLARAAWPDGSPIGKCLILDEPAGACPVVVGVVGDAQRQFVREAKAAQIYVPVGQPTDWFGPQAVLVRSSSRPGDLMASIRREAQAVHPDMPAVDVRLLRDRLDPQYRPWKLGATAFSAFGIVAFVLAFAGLYAVTARSVLERQREAAIRLALGAAPPSLVRLLVARGLALAAIGAAIGVGMAVVVIKIWGDSMVEDLRLEPWRLLAAALATCALAALAAYLPARRFGHVDPSEVLREG
jgi:putative ABC transport system permease protein